MSAIARRYYTDPGSGCEVIHSRQDYEPILAMNRALKNAYRRSSRLEARPGLGTRVAQIPNLLIEEWRQKGIDFYTDEGLEFIVRRILNDPEYADLRTAPGRV